MEREERRSIEHEETMKIEAEMRAQVQYDQIIVNL